MRRNALAALAAARAVGVEPAGEVDVALSSAARSADRAAGGIVVVNDCYNANPMSMRAALDDLAASAPGAARRRARRHARARPRRGALPRGDRRATRATRGVDVLVTVGPLAARMGAAFDGGAAAATSRTPRAPRRARAEPARARRHRPRQGARAASGSRPSPRRSTRARPIAGADGRGPHRGHGRPAHLHLPVAEVHRLPARRASSASSSARRARRATTRRRARRRWAASSSCWPSRSRS